jgi:hypothetical protein
MVISVVVCGVLAVVGSVFGAKLLSTELRINAIELLKAIADGLDDG